jgi:hypothetical protein
MTHVAGSGLGWVIQQQERRPGDVQHLHDAEHGVFRRHVDKVTLGIYRHQFDLGCLQFRPTSEPFPVGIASARAFERNRWGPRMSSAGGEMVQKSHPAFPGVLQAFEKAPSGHRPDVGHPIFGIMGASMTT